MMYQWENLSSFYEFILNVPSNSQGIDIINMYFKVHPNFDETGLLSMGDHNIPQFALTYFTEYIHLCL